MNESSPELDTHERAALLDAVSGPVPVDFSERVVEAWQTERAPSVATLSRRWMSRRTALVAGVAAVAAALLLGWWGNGVVTERIEHRELQARLAAPRVEPPAELAQLRTKAHTLLSTHCSPCHDGALAQAKEGALAVFDTSDDDWWLRMSERQLGVMLDRMPGEGSMTPDELEDVRRYVDAEIAFRKSGV